MLRRRIYFMPFRVLAVLWRRGTPAFWSGLATERTSPFKRHLGPPRPRLDPGGGRGVRGKPRIFPAALSRQRFSLVCTLSDVGELIVINSRVFYEGIHAAVMRENDVWKLALSDFFRLKTSLLECRCAEEKCWMNSRELPNSFKESVVLHRYLWLFSPKIFRYLIQMWLRIKFSEKSKDKISIQRFHWKFMFNQRKFSNVWRLVGGPSSAR